jgi:hypothetical protein
MMVSTGAEDGTMKPEALREDGGLLLEPLEVEESDTSMAISHVFAGCAPPLKSVM